MRDLSHPLATGMQVYPGDPEVHLQAALELERDGVAVTALRFGSHTGTHIDAPSHTISGGRTLDRVGLDELVGDALVLHVPGLADGATVTTEDLGDLPDRVPPIVVLDLGWARHFGTARALAHPAVGVEVARLLVDRGMRVLGVDTLSPDPTGPEGGGDFPVHEVVLGADGLIVENLAGLDGLPTRTRIGIFPLRLAGDGAPVRAVAFD
ncbi:cyclase family protein [Naasia sp. SYSU D00057]|uniref:cyclase family protein n=1 Tax=Naasia sp. SYSU D00057 TaxID=2817380 RepID=UPI001B315098|nr:cyclase family protein [Naasia sp. SYSU D00057]